MLEFLLICDSNGSSIYSRKLHDTYNLSKIESLPGLISTLDSMGRTVFKKDIAIVTFGEDNLSNISESTSKIVLISKDTFAQEKRINFVYLSSGDCSMQLLRELTTTIYMELKPHLRMEPLDYKKIEILVNKILDNKFKGVVSCR